MGRRFYVWLDLPDNRKPPVPNIHTGARGPLTAVAHFIETLQRDGERIDSLDDGECFQVNVCEFGSDDDPQTILVERLD